MSDVRDREAHALSLPLFSLIDSFDGNLATLEETVEDIRDFILSHNLTLDISPVVNREETAVQITSLSPFGEVIIRELRTRCEFFPCPEGTCEYGQESFCKWCGTLKR